MSTLALDLDSTLIYTINHGNIPEVHLYRDINVKYPDKVYTLKFRDGSLMYGYFRPYLQEFLTDAFRYYDNVTIYTAGTKEYGELLAEVIENRFNVKFDRVLTRGDCLKIDSQEFLNKDDYSKPLRLAFPDLDLKQMLLVDDKMCNFRFNPRNGILIPAYSPMTEAEVFNDDELGRLWQWITSVKIINAKDVRELNKDNIFGVDVLVDIF